MTLEQAIAYALDKSRNRKTSASSTQTEGIVTQAEA
jgi:hypothetical protein